MGPSGHAQLQTLWKLHLSLALGRLGQERREVYSQSRDPTPSSLNNATQLSTSVSPASASGEP